MLKLKKTSDGTVNYLFKAGNDYVKGQVDYVKAEVIMAKGELIFSSVAGYPICVDGKWFFEGEEDEPVKAPRTRKGRGK